MNARTQYVVITAADSRSKWMPSFRRANATAVLWVNHGSQGVRVLDDKGHTIKEYAAPSSLNRARPNVDAYRHARLSAEARARSPIMIHDLEVYTWEANRKSGPRAGETYYAAEAFVGNQTKPVWYHFFSTPEKRDQYITETIAQRRRHKQGKEARKAEQKAVTPPPVGTILYTSWGYDQTNVDFYQVIAIRKSVIDVQKIGKHEVANARGRQSEGVIPDETHRGKILTGQKPRAGGWVTIEGHSASPWKGNPVHETAFGYGHAKTHQHKSTLDRASPHGSGDRLFSGIYPTGIVYADRSREVNGDYRRLAFLSFSTLDLKWEKGVPTDLRKRIEASARAIQAKRGEQYQVSTTGQTVMLGGASGNRAAPHRDPRALKAYQAVVFNRLRRKGMSAKTAELTVNACAANIRAAKRQGKTTKWVANKCFAAAAFSKRAAG